MRSEKKLSTVIHKKMNLISSRTYEKKNSIERVPVLIKHDSSLKKDTPLEPS